MEALKKRGIGTGIHYRALHQHSYYKNKYGLSDADFPVASFISKHTLSLPFSHSMTEKELERVADAVIEVLK
jgi:dTDP-4-amino-4,6-dideoxygalactose transaminase